MYVASDISSIFPFNPVAQRASRLEALAHGTAAISSCRQGMLGALLRTTIPSTRHGLPALRPLWVNEAMQRACDFVSLFGWMERDRSRNQAVLEAEWRLVHELVSLYTSLDNGDGEMLYACSHAIRTAARDHVELFGCGSEPMKVCTVVDRLALPAYRQRALVLAACRLIIEALHRVAARPSPSRLVVLLTVKPGCAILSVTQDLSGPYRAPDRHPSDCTLDLAALLECDVVVEAQRHCIATSLRFPVAV
jgi:hypothetical protein